MPACCPVLCAARLAGAEGWGLSSLQAFTQLLEKVCSALHSFPAACSACNSTCNAVAWTASREYGDGGQHDSQLNTSPSSHALLLLPMAPRQRSPRPWT